MTLVEYAESLVKNLVEDAEMIKVKDFETEEGVIIEILVSEQDMAKVIGRAGKIANSIKTLIQTKAYIDGIKDIKVNIDSF